MDESVVKELEQQADLRAIFERVKAHLLAQNCQSMTDGECAYRGEDGLRCAVGVLIEDRHYSRFFEGGTVCDASVAQALALSGVGVSQRHLSLLADLQNMHDLTGPPYWPTRLEAIERQYFGT